MIKYVAKHYLLFIILYHYCPDVIDIKQSIIINLDGLLQTENEPALFHVL